MSERMIKIQHCNNIKEGEIVVYTNKLNIIFGANRTGKSTIAQAISLASQNKQLTELNPYGRNNEDATPLIEGIPTGNVAIFDEEYINQYIFQPTTLIGDTFEVLIRSNEYDEAKKNIDDALLKIKTTITGRQEITNLQNHIGVLIEKISFTAKNTIAKRGGVKGVLEGKGAYFNLPPELTDLNPFFEENIVSKWATWRLQGYEQFGNKGCCPYCSISDSDKTEEINRVFADSFDKPSIETAAAIANALEALKPYLNEEKTDELVSLFGVKGDLDFLESQITKLLVEANYLHKRLTAIVSFNGSSVDRANIANLESKLKEMEIDLRDVTDYFVSELFKSEMNLINSEINSLIGEVNVLKGEIGKYNTYIQDKIKDRTEDINEFLTLAGFKYSFEVETNGENNARSILKFIMPGGNIGDVQSSGSYLSWGERNAFALILFMFDAISQTTDLIILDDPLSSFDNNKKYAIINRLFKTRVGKDSFYQKTVLMLTHDFQPVIDYIQVGAGRQDPSTVCAYYLENNNGHLICTPIQKNSDLLSSVVLLKELAMDVNIDIAARIGCLRKFIEHQYRNPREESDAYNILSSLVHRRTEPTSDSEGKDKLTSEQISKGYDFIKDYIFDFDYNSILEQCTPKNLIDRYSDEQSEYIKMLILRTYIESDEEIRDRLRRTNDVLRKYVDETHHIENDYLYSLDLRRFNIVPEHYSKDAEKFITDEEGTLNNTTA